MTPDASTSLKGRPPPSKRRKAATHRAAMNKTGARILGGFAAALISWIWSGWFEPWTGVAMGDAMLTSLGGAMIVLTEWAMVKD